MTGVTALEQACHIVHETDVAQYEPAALTWINVVITELYDVANRRRISWGEDEFQSVPILTSLTDDLPYDDELIYKTFVKGLVCRLFSEEMDNSMLGMYKQEFALAVNECDRAKIKFASPNDKEYGWT